MIATIDLGWVEASSWPVTVLVLASKVVRMAAAGRCCWSMAYERLHRWVPSREVLSHPRKKPLLLGVRGQ
jgi:hypothetical protein